MKKIVDTFIVIALSVLMAACGKSAQAPMENISEPIQCQPQSTSEPVQSSIEPSESTTNIPTEYKRLNLFCNQIRANDKLWTCVVPDMNNSREHVNITEEMKGKIYKIFTENEPFLQPEMLLDGSSDYAGGFIDLYLSPDDKLITSDGDNSFHVGIIPLGQNNPVAPNSTVVTFLEYQTYYSYPAEVYDKLFALLKANIVETHATFEGAYVKLMHDIPEFDEPEEMRLEPPPGIIIWRHGDIFECDNMLVYSRYSALDGEAFQYWQMESFDLSTGKLLYAIEYKGDDEKLGKLEDIPDYDFVIYYEKGFIYRSNKEPDKEVRFYLPQDVKPLFLRKKDPRTTPYDEYDDSIVWTDRDGIRLRTAKQDGITQKLLLPNTELVTIFPELEKADDFVYSEPRFVSGGGKVAAMVYSKSRDYDVGAVVIDISSGEIHSVLSDHLQPGSSTFPLIADRFLAVRGKFNAIQLLDMITGEITEAAFNGKDGHYWFYGYGTFDYKTFIVTDPTSAYVGEAEQISDPFSPSLPNLELLLRFTEPYADVFLVDETEHYAIFTVHDFEGKWLAAAKYR